MAASSSSASPPWIELPDDLTANILQRLYTKQILMSARKVCRTWWRVCKNPAMWRVIDLDCRSWPDEEFDSVCRRIVDRSQGQLFDLTLTLIGFDKDYGILNYIANRSSQLRCLTLEVFRINIAVIIKFTQLEELHLMMLPGLTVKDIESIGVSCPMLKSFTYNNTWYHYPEFTEQAVTIGKNMPNLRYLRLFSLRIENKGLEAILNGCPGLESLHLPGCYGLDLQGILGKRCSGQIKDLTIKKY